MVINKNPVTNVMVLLPRISLSLLESKLLNALFTIYRSRVYLVTARTQAPGTLRWMKSVMSG